MSKLTARFAEWQAAGRKGLLPYITGGYPDVETTVALLKAIDPDKCACVEIGIPYSDPIADGPVIQASFSRALEGGFRLDALLDALAAQRDEIAVPLVAMVSYSIVYRRTPHRFVERIRAAGMGGLIVPDLAFEEAEELAEIGRGADCPLVLMVAPTTSADRRQRIAELSEPFIYCQALTGVTGERSELPAGLAAQLRELRGLTNKPLCVGFGIATAEHVRQVCTLADGAIVGSAIVRRMNAAVERNVPRADLVQDVVAFIGGLTAGLP